MVDPYIASPLNYIGGKHKLLPQIIPLFPQDINTFVDLFCGGGNVGINVNAQQVLFNDNLTFLIDLYKVFKAKTKDDVLAYIENRIVEFDLSRTNQVGYLKLRHTYNTNRNALDLFVLVAYSFNHQIRFNSSHEFNNPFGKERSSFNSRMKDNLLKFITELHNKSVLLSAKNFNELDLSQLKNNDFVYADPPYLITTGTYNDGKRGFTGWNETIERELLKLLDSLTRRHIKFALSNVLEHKGKTNNILKQWIEQHNYNVHFLHKNYTNCNYHTNDKDTNTSEVLITNYKI